MLDVRELLHEMMSMGATDLYLCTGAPPVVRIHGQLQRLNYPELTPVTAHQSIYALLNSSRRAALEENLKADFAYSIPGLSRFRVSLSLVRGTVAALFRTIPLSVPTVEELGLPQSVAALADAESGLILVAGPSGSGRSTTLAALIDRINAAREFTVQCIEDPIEFIHEHKRAVVAQQEVGMDTRSCYEALEQAARQGHDVLMVGSLSDARCAEVILSIAESGRLVLTAMRARGVVEALQRLVALFPSDRRRTVESQLAAALTSACCQILIPRRAGGRVALFEQLTATSAARAALAAGDYEHLQQLMEQGGKGMAAYDSSLTSLEDAGIVDGAAVRNQFYHYLEPPDPGEPPGASSRSTEGGEQ